MIESYYWRTELRNDLAWLKNHQVYRRWSEKQEVLFERKLMLVAFQVRSRLERSKVNDQARSTSMSVFRYKKTGDRPFTVMGAGWLHERFNMEYPEPATLTVPRVCKQLIHYYWMRILSEGRAFVSMLVFSDCQRHKWTCQLLIEDILKLFRVIGNNSSAVVVRESKWVDKKQDYVVTRSWGR